MSQRHSSSCKMTQLSHFGSSFIRLVPYLPFASRQSLHTTDACGAQNHAHNTSLSKATGDTLFATCLLDRCSGDAIRDNKTHNTKQTKKMRPTHSQDEQESVTIDTSLLGQRRCTLHVMWLLSSR